MGARRGNSEGSITKRPDGRWEARITLENGGRKSFYAKTRQEAVRRLTEALRDQQQGMPIVGEKQTVGQFLTSWLQTVKPTIRARTWQRYEEYVRLHIIPMIGSVVLSRLTPQQVQQLYATKVEQGLATTTVKHLHTVLHRALHHALRFGLVQRNVTELVDVPKMDHPEMATLTEDQARAFIQAAKTDRLEALYVLALTSGMRQGELLALRWRDVDLKTGTVLVRATLQKTADGFTYAPPKTKRSRRKITLTSIAIEALHRHHARQSKERLALGTAWQDRDLVFPNTVGDPIQKSNLIYQSFRPLLERAGLPLIRFHDLRHTAATLMLLQGVHPKVVSEMLGHASISITLDLYSHVLPNMQKDATAALDRLLGN